MMNYIKLEVGYKVFRLKVKLYRYFRYIFFKYKNYFRIKFKIRKFIRYLFYDFTGIRFVYEKLNPPKENINRKPPSTLLIWIIGLYIAFWGLATQVYESKNAKIQTRLSSSMIGLESNENSKNYETLISCQYMVSPIEPEIFRPWTSYFSLIGREDYDEDVIDDVKDFIITKSDNLNKANLSNVDLSGRFLMDIDLSEADLSKAILMKTYISNANLSDSNLSEADISNADLSNADLSNANLSNANLSNTDLSEANLSNANLSNANLSNADLSRTNLSEVNLRDEQIKEILTFYEAEFKNENHIDKVLQNRIREIAHKKLEKPSFHKDPPIPYFDKIYHYDIGRLR